MHVAKFLVALVFATAPLESPRALAESSTLRIGLQEDPDILDPAQGVSFVGREVFAALCDKLVDVDRDLKIVPQLATEWSWSPDTKSLTLKLRDAVKFHDGTAFDAEAVKANLDRYRMAPESKRKGELKPVKEVVAVDPRTVRIELSAPYAPLLAVLADRSGMILSKDALAREGDKIGTKPVCSGPYRFVERVAGAHRRRALPELLERRLDRYRPHRLHPGTRQHRAARQSAIRQFRDGRAARRDRREDG